MSIALSLLDIINTELASDNLQLPVYSPVAARVQLLASRSETTASEMEEVLMLDQTLASQVLRVANSAFYAGLSPVETVRVAVLRLGLDQIVEIAVLCAQKGQFESQTPEIAAILRRLWKHSVCTALGARWLAARSGYRNRAGEAFMAGLFHDIGKLLILRVVDDVRRKGAWTRDLPESLLQELLREQHAEQGARLLSAWNLPQAYVAVARSHHDPEPPQGDPLALIVRLANQTCTKLGLNVYPDPGVVLAASPEAAELGIKDVTIAELEIALEDEASIVAA